jgi:hypothetical protein
VQNVVLWSLFGGLIAQLVLVIIEVTSHGSVSVEMATAAMMHGQYRGRFWFGVLGGMAGAGALALVGALQGNVMLGAVAGVLAIAGLAAYEDAFVRAGQSVPLS